MFPINLLRCQGNLTKTFLCHERSREPPDDLVSQLSQASCVIPKCHDVNERKCMTKALGECDLPKDVPDFISDIVKRRQCQDVADTDTVCANANERKCQISQRSVLAIAMD